MASDETSPRPPSSRVGSSGPGWVPPSVEELQALLPQYEILSMLGHGGMGAVYKGKQKSLDRLVAIKILPPGLDDADAKFTERFKNEARTMAKMNHPGIVSVHDFGETAEGQLYFIMEYVDGTDVAQMIKASVKLPQDYALAITAHVCDALAYAHSHGVIHRDIKPANILINMQGQVKVADFGLAKQDDASQTTGLTKTGMAMGTPDYVAPEALIMGSHVDGRADLYAVGVMLYQMLTGEIPRGMFLMPSIRNRGETDPRFDTIIARAMQTDRESRYQTAMELRRDLDVILTTPRIKQDASKGVAAVPQKAVQSVPGQRSAAQKPVMHGPGQPAAHGKPLPERAAGTVQGDLKSPISKSKSKRSPLPAIVGIAATLLLAAGLVFVFGGKKRSGDTPVAESGSNNRGKSAAAPSAPIKVIATPAPAQARPAEASAASATPRLSPSTEPWVDRMKEVRAANAARDEASGLRFDKATRIPLTPALKDGAVRMLFTYSGSDDLMANCTAIVRATPNNSFSGYLFRVNSSRNRSLVNLAAAEPRKAPRQLQDFNVGRKPGLPPDQPIELELRAVGTKITAKLNGVELGTADDSTFTEGPLVIGVEAGTLLHAVETLDLSKPAPVASSAVALPVITGWQDLMGAAKEAIPRMGYVELKEDNGWLVASKHKGTAGVPLDTKDWKNTAMRGRVRGHVYVGLRSTSALPGYYNVQFAKDGTGSIELVTSNPRKSTRLANFTMSRAQEHDFLVTMTGPDIRLWVDGALATTARDTTIARGTPSIGLAAEGAAIRDLAIAEPPSDFFAQAPTTATDSGAGWIDGLAEWWSNPANASSGILSKTADGLTRAEKKSGITPRLSASFKDVAIRATLRHVSNYASFYVRNDLKKAGEGGLYTASFFRNGTITVSVFDGPFKAELGKFPGPAGFSPDASHTVEFRVQGDILTAILDGKITGSVKDSRVTEGNLLIACDPGTLIEKLEYSDLSTATSAATGERWVDGLAEFWAKHPRGFPADYLARETGGSRVGNVASVKAWEMRGGDIADVAIRATLSGAASFNLCLRAGEENSRYQAGIDSKGGWISINRGPGESEALKKFAIPAGFVIAGRHAAEFRAQGDALTFLVDGKEVASVRDARRTTGSGYLVASPGTLIEKLEYRELAPMAGSGGTPAAVASPPGDKSVAAPGDRQWVDGLAEWWAKSGKSGWLVKEPGGSRTTNRNGIRCGNARDMALRVQVRNASSFWSLALRGAWSSQSLKDTREYYMQVSPAGGTLQRRVEQIRTELAKFDLPAGFVFADSHIGEFRAQGDLLTCLLDGAEVARVRDSEIIEAGAGSYVGGEGTLIEKLEYLELSPVAGSGGTPAVDLPWRDFLAEKRQAGGFTDPLADDGTQVRWVKNGTASLTFANEAAQGQPVRDVAVRMRWTPNLADSQARFIGARPQSDGSSFTYYSLSVDAKGLGLGRVTVGGAGGYADLLRFSHPAGFDPAKEHELELRAVGDEISVRRDGQFIGAVRDSVLTEGPRASFGASEGTVIRKLDYALLDGVKVAPSLVAPASDGPWTDALGPVLAKKPFESSIMEKMGAGARMTKLQGWILDRKEYADAAVRVTARSEGDGAMWWIMLRHSVSADAKLRNRYAAKLDHTKRGRILLEGSKTLELAAFDLPAGFSLAENHTMEFRAQGDRLSVAVDGREMAAVHDRTHTSGMFEIMGSPGTVFEKVEWRELPPVAERASVPTAAASSGNRQISDPASSGMRQHSDPQTGGATTPPSRPAEASAASATTAPADRNGNRQIPDPRFVTLIAQYTGAVAKAAAAAKAADKPAFDAELARLKTGAPLPDAAADVNLPAELKRLRAVLRAQMK